MRKFIHLLTKPYDQLALFLFVVSVLLVSLIITRSPTDYDMWWHLGAGRAMWENGEILTTDIFSYTRNGQPWVNAFWVTDILMYLVYRIGGFFTLTVSVSFMAVLTLFVIYKHSKSPLPIRLTVTVLAALVMLPIWSARPQLLSFFFVAILDFFLSSKNEDLNKPFWLLIPLFALWPNFHGGFIFGFLLLVALIIGKLLEPILYTLEDWRSHQKQVLQLLGFTILAALAVGLNPNGLSIWKLPFYTVDVSLAIREWQSPDFHQIYLHPFLWLFFLLVVALGFSQKRISLFDLFKTLGFAYMTFYSQRSIALFGIVAAPVVARYLSVSWDDWKGAPIGLWLAHLRSRSNNKPVSGTLMKIINIFTVSLLLILVLVNAFNLSLPSKVYAAYPKKAVSWIKDNHPQGQMLNSYNTGGYLIWDLPDYPVFIDGRADLYGDEIMDQWRNIVKGTDYSLTLLNEWGVNFALLEPDLPIVMTLQSAGWEVLFKDDLAVVLVR